MSWSIWDNYMRHWIWIGLNISGKNEILFPIYTLQHSTIATGIPVDMTIPT
jgi:hypothetical protein